MSYGARARVAVSSFGRRIGAAGTAIASFGKRVGSVFTKAITRLDRFLGVPKGEGIIEMMQGSPVRKTPMPRAETPFSTPMTARTPSSAFQTPFGGTDVATTLSGRVLTRSAVRQALGSPVRRQLFSPTGQTAYV